MNGPHSGPAGEPAALVGTLRHMLLGLLLLGMAGTGAELVLLEHTETWTQWVPLVALAAGILAGTLVAIRPSPRSIALLRGIMTVFIAAGIAGLYLHYRGNAEFELEMYPSLEGFELMRKSLSGATPALAPGTMVQLGLLGWLWTYRHPRSHRDGRLTGEGK